LKRIIISGFLFWFVFALSAPAGLKPSANGQNYVQHDSKKGINRLEKQLNRKLNTVWSNWNTTPVFVGGKLTEPGYINASDVNSGCFSFFKENTDLFGISEPEKELKNISVLRDNLSMTHIKYQQQIDNIPIYQGQLVVHLNTDGSIESVNGRYYPTPIVKSIPAISNMAAISIAKARLGNYTALSEKAELNFYERNNKLELIYIVSLPSGSMPSMKVFVNASDGSVIKTDNGIRYDGPAIGTGTGLDGKSKQIHTYLYGGRYYLIDASLPMFKTPIDSLWGVVETYDAQNDTNGSGYNSVQQITDPNNDNNFSDSVKYRAAVNAHSFSNTIYKFYKSHYGRNSFDNKGSSITNIVHYKQSYNNAFWNGQFMTYGDGDDITFSNFAGGFDVAVHEFTHGVTEHTAGLIYEFQPGALNESMSDVIATCADSTNWLIGEDIFTPSISGDALRNMQDPHNGNQQGSKFWQPAKMSEYVTLPNTEDGDYGGVHKNSGIPNKAFYNVASVIGCWEAGQIWYRSLTVYLTNNSQFTDLRTACLNSAKDLYGNGSTEYNTVASAFTDVGITDGGSTGQTSELIYDDGNPGTGVYENAANWQLAMRFTPPVSNFEVTNVKVYITGDFNNRYGSFYLVIYNANSITGLPNTKLISPYYYTPQTVGWQSFDLAGVYPNSDFYVSVSYDGFNVPMIGADTPPGSGRSYEYAPTQNLWYSLYSINQDYTLFIRATIKTLTSVVELDTKTPKNFELKQNYPNPFNPSTKIQYALPKGDKVSLAVYDITGRKVCDLVNNFQNAGTYEVTWNGKDNFGKTVASGIYFYSFKNSQFQRTLKMVLTK